MTVRPYQTEDFEKLYEINESNVPAVNSLATDQLVKLLELAFSTLVIDISGEIAGFVLTLTEGIAYDSHNYAWISERYETFVYVDRIAIAERYRNQGHGKSLYKVLETIINRQRPTIYLEVNEVPPNPESYRFHRALGFEDIGRRTYQHDGGEKTVVFMSKVLR